MGGAAIILDPIFSWLILLWVSLFLSFRYVLCGMYEFALTLVGEGKN